MRKFLGAAVALGLFTMPALAQDADTPPMEVDVETDMQTDDMATDDMGSTEVNVNQISPAPAPVPDNDFVAVEEERQEERRGAEMRGVGVMLGGGVEGYTGDLAPQLNPGPMWGARAALKPTRVLGIELGYTGAVNEIDQGRGDGFFAGPGAASGADVVRNGGEALATIGLSATPVQPYIMGGIGLDRYSVRGAAEATGFQDDTSGHVPLGIGLRTHVGNFTADARVGYNVLFDNEFATGVTTPDEVAGIDTIGGGRYQGTINLGATF